MKKKLHESTLNFRRNFEHKEFPLLVFISYDEFLDSVHNDSECPKVDDYADMDDYYEALYEFEDNYADKYFKNIAILDFDAIDEIKNDIDEFNGDTKIVAGSLDVDKYYENQDLEDIMVELKDGYYSGAYIDVNHENYFDNLDEGIKQEQISRFANFLNELKGKYGLTTVSCDAVFSNGEGVYSIKESIAKKDKHKNPINENLLKETLISKLENIDECGNEGKINAIVETFDHFDSERNWTNKMNRYDISTMIYQSSDINDLVENLTNRLLAKTINKKAVKEAVANKKLHESFKKLHESVQDTFQLSTENCPILDAGLYYPLLGELLPEDKEEQEEFYKVVEDQALPILDELVKHTPDFEVVSVDGYYHPKYYNYETDALYFTVKYLGNELGTVIEEYSNNPEFIEFLKNYKSYDGFISFFADNRDDFITQEVGKSVAQILKFNVNHNDYEKATEDLYYAVSDYGYYPTEDAWYESLTEAPDEMGFDTDDELEAQERAEFEKRLAQRKAQRDDAKKQELDRQEQERAKEQAKKDAEEKGKELYAKCEELPYDEWFDVLVPSSGKADTVAGEIVRAIAKIEYRHYNDGDKFYEGYGRETCGSSAVYLYELGHNFSEILEKMVNLNDENYEKEIEHLKDFAKEFLLENPSLFGTINENDSRSSKEYDISAYSEFDEPKDYEWMVDLRDYEKDGISLYDYMNNGDIDSWEFIDRLKEDVDAELHGNSSFTIDRPWSHYDDTYTISNLTKDEYETVKDYLSRSDYFDSYLDELYDRYGDPNEEDYEEEDEEVEENLTENNKPLVRVVKDKRDNKYYILKRTNDKDVFKNDHSKEKFDTPEEAKAAMQDLSKLHFHFEEALKEGKEPKFTYRVYMGNRDKDFNVKKEYTNELEMVKDAKKDFELAKTEERIDPKKLRCLLYQFIDGDWEWYMDVNLPKELDNYIDILTKENVKEDINQDLKTLAKDEQEAIDGYDKAINNNKDAKVTKQLKTIRDEENAHLDFLNKAQTDKDLEYSDIHESGEKKTLKIKNEGAKTYTEYEDLVRVNNELGDKARAGKLLPISMSDTELRLSEPEINGIWTIFLDENGNITKITLF